MIRVDPLDPDYQRSSLGSGTRIFRIQRIFADRQMICVDPLDLFNQRSSLGRSNADLSDRADFRG